MGMGQTVYNAFQEAREVFEQANDVLGRDLTKLLFAGPEELLKQTTNSQLAIYVTSIAILRVIERQFPTLKPAFCAGHSLGEYSAVTAGGWLSYSASLPLVQKRADLMHQACTTSPGTMAAVLGMDEEQIGRLIAKVGGGLWAANFNCPGQIVLSGTLTAMQKASEWAKEFGAKRIVPLQVQGAFHSGLMQHAAEQLAHHLEQLSFASVGVPLVLNATAEVTISADGIRAGLIRQMTSSVHWEQSVRQMRDCSLFVEIGAGQVLAGLNRKIGISAPTISVGIVTDLEALAKEASSNTLA